MATATLKAKLTLGISNFQANIRKAEGIAKKSGDKIRKALDTKINSGIRRGAGIGAIAATLGGAALAKGIKGAYDMGGALSDLMARTTASGESLQILSQAMSDAGVEGANAGDVINTMQKAISAAAGGNKAFAKTFKDIGLNAKDMKGMRPEIQFQEIGRAIRQIEDPADRAAASMKLFKGSGKELLAVFADDGAIESATKTLGSQAKILAVNAAAFDVVSDRLGHVGTKLNSFFIGAASTFLPAMLSLTSAMEKADFATQGERFGKGMKEAADLFTGVFADPGKLFGSLKDYLTSMFLEIANQFVHFVLTAFDGITGEIAASFNHIGATLLAIAEQAVSKMPGGTEQKDAQKRANQFAEQEVEMRKKAAQYAAAGDRDRAEKTAMIANRAELEKNRALRIAKGELTLTERIAEIKKRDGIEAHANKLRGGANSWSNSPNLFGMAPDRFGARGYASSAAVKLQQARQAGAAVLGEMMGPPAPGGKTNPFAKFTTMGFGASGLGATGGLNSGGLGGAYNRIRRGDAARAKAEAKNPVEETNDILSDIKTTIVNAWGT